MSQNRTERIQELVDQREEYEGCPDIRELEACALRAVLEEFACDLLAEFDAAWKRPGSFWDVREATHRELIAGKAQYALERALSADLHSRQTPAERQAELDEAMTRLGISEYEQNHEA